MTTYTYRNGERIDLYERPDQIVVRAEPSELPSMAGVDEVEQVSPGSMVVTVDNEDAARAILESADVVTMPSYYQAETDSEFLITDRIFVTFHDGLTDLELGEFAGRHGLRFREQYGENDFLFQIVGRNHIDPVELLRKLVEEEASVEAADHDLNYLVEPENFVPTDPAYLQQWYLHLRSQQADFDPRASANCEAAWQQLNSYGDRDVVIGITDDGCRLDHKDFDSAGKFAGWGYFRGEQLVTMPDIAADPNQMYKPGANHGTACAGVAAGEADAILTVGAAPNCRLFPIKWESSGRSLSVSDSKLMRAFMHMSDKVDIISNSWSSRSPVSQYAPMLLRLIRRLANNGGRRGKGIVFIWSAGNANRPLQYNGPVQIPYTSGWQNGRWVGVERSRRFANSWVGIPGVMLVAALASTGQRSHYSNYGTGVSLCAPSSNSHAYGRLRLRGLRVVTAEGTTPTSIRNNFGGTSSSAPLVAGIAALVISADPNLTAREVVSVLQATARKNLNLNGYPRTPPASFDGNPTWDISPVAPFDSPAFQNNGHPDGSWSPWFGHGCVDALAAVMRAQGATIPRSLTVSAAPDRPIPDRNPNGITDSIRVTENGAVTDIAVNVKITHTWSGDLVVRLVAPDGDAVTLQRRSGGRRDDIDKQFTIATVADLQQLVGSDVGGTWQLHVQDLAARDVGRLKTWGLEFQLNGTP